MHDHEDNFNIQTDMLSLSYYRMGTYDGLVWTSSCLIFITKEFWIITSNKMVMMDVLFFSGERIKYYGLWYPCSKNGNFWSKIHSCVKIYLFEKLNEWLVTYMEYLLHTLAHFLTYHWWSNLSYTSFALGSFCTNQDGA